MYVQSQWAVIGDSICEPHHYRPTAIIGIVPSFEARAGRRAPVRRTKPRQKENTWNVNCRAPIVRLDQTTPARERHTVHLLAGAVIVLNAVGNSLLRVGLSSNRSVSSFAPAAYLAALADPWVILGVVLLFGWMILQLSLLSWADLTYVLPVTSLSYVLIAMIGAFALNEPVSPAHWFGISMIVGGVIIAGRTRPLTTGSEVRR
jgi:hypothetical protein